MLKFKLQKWAFQRLDTILHVSQLYLVNLYLVATILINFR